MDTAAICHVTMSIYTNFRSPNPWRLHMKFGFNWPSRNDITTLAFYDRHGSDSILSLQCNSWKVIHFPPHNMGLQGLLLNILQ